MDTYKQALNMAVPRVLTPSGWVIGQMEDTSGFDISTLYDGLLELEAHPSQTLKHSSKATVLLGELQGLSVVAKRYDLTRFPDRFRYIGRPTRARRAWAASLAMKEAGLPTPQPLGIVEGAPGLPKGTSYFVTSYLEHSCTCSKWIKTRYRFLPDKQREIFRRQLLETIWSLFDKGMYHDDLKTLNLLLTDPDDPERRAFYWIDLESVRVGHTPTRKQIIRNLIQLNGSVAGRVAEEDRMAFLAAFADRFPWVTEEAHVEYIKLETHRRLQREIQGLDGA